MSITVNLSNASEQITSRMLKANEGISVWGNVRGLILPAQFQKVRLDIPELGFFSEKSTNVWGDYNFYFVTPSRRADLTLRVSSYFPTGVETVEVPVSVEKSPPPLPVQEQSSNFLSKPLTTFAAIAGLALAAYLLIPRLMKK